MEDRLNTIKEALMCLVEAQIDSFEKVDAQELGEVIDMIKDLEEANYYYSVVHAMEEASEETSVIEHFKKTSLTNDNLLIKENQDPREGKSYKFRKAYMESKESHQEKSIQMRELEKYMQELAQDIIEMVNEATLEEKLYLSKKIQALATKLNPSSG